MLDCQCDRTTVGALTWLEDVLISMSTELTARLAQATLQLDVMRLLRLDATTILYVQHVLQLHPDSNLQVMKSPADAKFCR